MSEDKKEILKNITPEQAKFILSYIMGSSIVSAIEKVVIDGQDPLEVIGAERIVITGKKYRMVIAFEKVGGSNTGGDAPVSTSGQAPH